MITDIHVLRPEFVLQDVVHRNTKVSHLLSALHPITDGDLVETALLRGPSGVGNTCIARFTVSCLHENVDKYDVVVTHELDRLGRSFADLVGFVEGLREIGVDIDFVNHPIGTVGEDDWMAEITLNMMMVFADAERKMIRSRVQEGIDAAITDSKHVSLSIRSSRQVSL